MSKKRRALVLGDESARHPFLASLPLHVRRIERNLDRRSLTSGPGWRDFLMAYCTCLAAVSVFIA
jgi:hypothetical protein